MKQGLNCKNREDLMQAYSLKESVHIVNETIIRLNNCTAFQQVDQEVDKRVWLPFVGFTGCKEFCVLQSTCFMYSRATIVTCRELSVMD